MIIAAGITLYLILGLLVVTTAIFAEPDVADFYEEDVGLAMTGMVLWPFLVAYYLSFRVFRGILMRSRKAGLEYRRRKRAKRAIKRARNSQG